MPPRFCVKLPSAMKVNVWCAHFQKVILENHINGENLAKFQVANATMWKLVATLFQQRNTVATWHAIVAQLSCHLAGFLCVGRIMASSCPCVPSNFFVSALKQFRVKFQNAPCVLSEFSKSNGHDSVLKAHTRNVFELTH